MGQRHQLFVIARISGRYRQLAAIHHQWLYGHTALRRCLDTLKIFGNHSNRLPIEQELIAASKKDDDFWVAPADKYRDDKNSHVPFPFIMTCFIIGASFSVDSYYHGVTVEPFYMAFDEGDNNNGITIFDITDLNNVRYCFVDFYGMESKWEVELMTPLSARTYLEAYYLLDEPDEKTKEIGLIALVEKFEGRDLVTAAALRETWPDGEWHGDDSSEVDDEDSSTEFSKHTESNPATAGDASMGRKPTERSGDTEQGVTKSLRDHSMDGLLDMILDQSHSNSGLVAEAEILTDFIPKLRRRLYDQASMLQPTTSVLSLLRKALEQDIEIDLSPFTNFTMEDLSMLVAKLRGGRMRVLNLSNMPELDEPDLQLVLGNNRASSKQAETKTPSLVTAADTVGDLTAIILLETPKISIDFLTENLGHCDVYHSALFRRPMYSERYDAYGSPLEALQFAAANTVSQLVWVGISSMQSCDGKLRLENGHFDWSNLKYSAKASSRFSGAPGIKFKNFLLDVPLPAGKMVHSLRRLMQYLTSPNLGWFEDWPKAAAQCFATTSTLESGIGYSVGPLSTTLDRDDDREDYVESGKVDLLSLVNGRLF